MSRLLPAFGVACCIAPTQPIRVEIVDGRAVLIFPPGRIGGQSIPFVDRDSGEIHWIDCVIAGGGGSHERPVPVERFLSAVHAAAFMGVKLSTLYSWSPYLESAERRGSRLVFWTDVLVNVDIPEHENRLPDRDALLAERRERALAGEVVRPGRHVHGCLKQHDGPCTKTPPPSTRNKKGKR